MIDFDTLPTENDPQLLINSIDHTRRQHDSNTLLALLSKISNKKAVLWGEDIIGFGQYRYLYKTGREGYWPTISFSPSLQNISVNVMLGFNDYDSLLKKIGHVKHTTNTLILHKLSDINMLALENFLQQVFNDMNEKHSCS